MYALLSNDYTQVATDSLLLTISNIIALTANQLTTYTNSETYWTTETYTTNEMMELVQTQNTVVAPLQMGVNRTNGIFSIGVAPEYYDTLDAKLNNTTGAVSISIKLNSGVEVAVFSNNATRDVELTGNCNISNNFSVLGVSTVGDTMN